MKKNWASQLKCPDKSLIIIGIGFYIIVGLAILFLFLTIKILISM